MSLLDILSGIERRFRARAIPIARAVAAPPAGFALLWVDQLSGKLKLKRADGTVTTVGAGGGTSGPATAITETSGPTDLSVVGIADGALLQRSGTTVRGATAAQARAAAGLTPRMFGAEVLSIVAPKTGANFQNIGFPSTQAYIRATTARVTHWLRGYGRSSPAANTDASIIGGFGTEAGNAYARANSTSTWTYYHYFSVGAGTAFRGAAYVGNSGASAVDFDKVANNGFGVRLRPASSANFHAYSTDNAAATTASDLGVAPAANTNYIVEIQWNGTNVKVRIATIDDTTGVIGTWSTQATISTNLPTSTLDLSGAQAWFCHGTPATTPTLDIGGYDFVPHLSALA